MTTSEAWQAKSRLDEQEIRDLQRELDLTLERLEQGGLQRRPAGLLLVIGFAGGLVFAVLCNLIL